MARATITYTPDGGTAYVFTTQGATLYGMVSAFVADTPDGVPRQRKDTYTLRQLFLEDTFADNEARISLLRAALDGSEGTLVVLDETGQTLVNTRVVVRENSIPADWRQTQAIAEVKMTATVRLAVATAWDATYTPDGSPAVSLSNVTLVKGDLRTDFYNPMADQRAMGMETVFMEGVFRADPSLAPTARRAWLVAQKALVDAAFKASASGVLAHGDYSNTLRLTRLTVDLGDARDEARWQLSGERRFLPGDAKAHATFTVGTADNVDTAERVVTVKGTIQSTDTAAAEAKRDALKTAYTTAGTTLLGGSEWEEQRHDGQDGAASLRTWSFSFSWRMALPGAVVRATISVNDTTDYESGMITSTYSGRVVAASSAAALARARDFSSAYPWKISASETVNTATEGKPVNTEVFIAVEFSYVYRRRGSEKRAEVRDETSRQHFSTSSRTISGYTIADTEADAVALARSFRPSGVLFISEVESADTTYLSGVTGVFKRVDFTYVCHVGALDFTLEYEKETARDYTKGELRTSYSGTAWAATEAECDRAINALVATLANVRSDVRQFKGRVKGIAGATGTTYFMSKSFTISDVSDGTGDGGSSDGIIAAEWTIQTTFSHDHAVVTPIPVSTAHVQTSRGTVPGRKVATGSVRGRNLASLLTWARAKKPTGGHKTISDQDVENARTKTKPSPLEYSLEFTYPMTYPVLNP